MEYANDVHGHFLEPNFTVTVPVDSDLRLQLVWSSIQPPSHWQVDFERACQWRAKVAVCSGKLARPSRCRVNVPSEPGLSRYY